jgi:2-oxoglutarate ferredoxin oxidoreductase subunit gamma
MDPEARGGATRSDVIVSDRDIRFPKVNQPNVLICLTQEAYNKFSNTIRPGGLLLTDSHFVKPATKVDARQVELGMYKEVMDQIGKPVVFNICVLGAMLGLVPIVKKESIVKVIETKIPAGFLEMNRKALELGFTLRERRLSNKE